MTPPVEIVKEHVTPFVRRFLPGVDCSAPVLVEPCVYTMTDDHQFVLDELQKGMWLCSACSGHGFKFAPLIGATLADLVASGATPLLADETLQHFRLQRLLGAPRARL